MDYKKEEIKEYFDNFINDQDADWIEENKDDLHYHAFNTDYYIIGTYQAKQWLGDKVFEVIDHIKEYQKAMNFILTFDPLNVLTKKENNHE